MENGEGKFYEGKKMNLNNPKKSEEKQGGNPECKSSSHGQHLCYIVSQRLHLSDPEEYKALTADPKFKCEHCGRVAGSDESLCEPTNL